MTTGKTVFVKLTQLVEYFPDTEKVKGSSPLFYTKLTYHNLIGLFSYL